MNWEYWTVVVVFDKKNLINNPRGINDWVIKFSDGDKWIGWDTILENIGSNGWELVSATLCHWSGGETWYEEDAYRLFFKRPVAG